VVLKIVEDAGEDGREVDAGGLVDGEPLAA
jgi:hypothetical protein